MLLNLLLHIEKWAGYLEIFICGWITCRKATIDECFSKDSVEEILTLFVSDFENVIFVT